MKKYFLKNKTMYKLEKVNKWDTSNLYGFNLDMVRIGTDLDGQPLFNVFLGKYELEKFSIVSAKKCLTIDEALRLVISFNSMEVKKFAEFAHEKKYDLVDECWKAIYARCDRDIANK